MSNNFSGSVPSIALICALVLSVVFIALGAQGVRGTDQYNYLADTQTVLTGQAPVTNLLFPAKIIREADNPTPAGFHHNGPPIYVAAWLGKWFGAYHGWILMNILSHLVVAACLWVMLRAHTSLRITQWACSIYLVSPSAIWLGINVLQEMFFAALVALVLVGFTHRTRLLGLLTGIAALFVGVLSHPMFLPVALLFAFYLVIESVMARRFAGVGVFAGVGLAVGSFYLSTLKGVIFPSSFQPNLSAIITSSIPGESNMYWHYSLEQRAVTAELLMTKLQAAAQRHFFSLKEAPFYAYTNLAVIGLVYIAWRHVKSSWQLMLPLLVFLGLYASMIVLQQNQPRYQQIVAAASFVAIGFAWYRSGMKLPTYFLVALLIGNVSIAGYLSLSAARDASREQTRLTALSAQLQEAGLPLTARVAIFDLSPHSPMAITLKPRPVLSVRTDMMESDAVSEAVARFQPTHLILDSSTADALALSAEAGLKSEVLANLQGTFFGDIVVLHVDP